MSEKLTSALAPHNAALYCEDETEVARLAAAFREEHNPVGATEEHLVEELARAVWHTRRYSRMELGLVDLQTAQAADRMDCPRTQDRARTNPEIHHNNTILLGRAFHEDCNKERRAQERLARLQDMTQRAFLRVLKALHNEQDRRRKAQAQPQPQPESSFSAAAEAAAPASAPVSSNVVVLKPAAKMPASRRSFKIVSKRRRAHKAGSLNSPDISHHLDGLAPAG